MQSTMVQEKSYKNVTEIVVEWMWFIDVDALLRAFRTPPYHPPSKPHTALHFVALMWGCWDFVPLARLGDNTPAHLRRAIVNAGIIFS